VSIIKSCLATTSFGLSQGAHQVALAKLHCELVLCSLLRSPWADKREEREDTQPICLFQREQLTHTKEKRRTNKRKEGELWACPPSLSLEMADITPYPFEKRFSIRSRIFLSTQKQQQQKHTNRGAE
jgi:hypothetical protein